MVPSSTAELDQPDSVLKVKLLKLKPSPMVIVGLLPPGAI